MKKANLNYFLIFLYYLIGPTLHGDENHVDKEILFQVQNSSNSVTVKFKYSSVNETAIVYRTNTCDFFYPDSNFALTHSIIGNSTDDSYYTSIITDDQYPPSLFEMVHALLKIDVIVGLNTKKTFYFDTRDCRYYTKCPDNNTGDITIRYDYSADVLWFKKGANIDSVANIANGWEIISATTPTTKTFWDVYEIEHCIVTAPQKPSGLAVTFSGNNPRLDWNANTETDLGGYKIYKKDASPNYSQIATTTNTSYIDGSEFKPSKFDPQMDVEYFIKAYNTNNENSLPSNIIDLTVLNNNMQKKNNSLLNNKLEFKYKLTQNYPNPFNPLTIIKYSIKSKGYVFIAVYNELGEYIHTLVDEYKGKGNYQINFDGSNFANGVYYYRIITNEYIDTKKMILLK